MGPLATAIKHDLKSDDDDAHDASIDAVFEYLNEPSNFDPAKGRLSTFLCSIAKRRAVDRLRANRARIGREEGFAAVVEVRATAPKERMERDIEARELWRRVQETVQDPRDRRALELILDGERSTNVLAETLGLSSLPADEWPRAVKRHRDRLVKVLGRIGKRLRDDKA
jgi:RNA polymerase sigma-70 factor (ECF subfamily)